MVLLTGSLALSLLGCAAESPQAGADDTIRDEQPPPAACEDGVTRCEGDLVATCEGGAFGPAVACADESVCRDGACRAPSAKQRAQANELASMLRYIKDETAWHSPLDWDQLLRDGRKSIFGGDGSDRAYVAALYGAFMGVPQGHQSITFGRNCGTLVPQAGYSRRGACGRPHSRGIIVTNAKAGNVLGLSKGDLITSAGDATGKGILETLGARPKCTASGPTGSSRDTFTAATFSDLLESGETIEIESPDGSTRTTVVPDEIALNSWLSCSDPFGRNRVPAEAELRPDGVGIIRVPSFIDPEQPFPQNPTEQELAAYSAAFEAKILAAFESIKSAPAIVWDIRGNDGGLTLVGLHIASGFPGARSDAISYCQARIAKSDPPQFASTRYAEYALTPGGPFAYSGKVVVLMDGFNYSAADYFPLAVKTRTGASLIGAQAAGAFGATSMMRSFDGFDVSIDVNRCSSADDDLPLEGKGVIPHVAVEYDPKDLAAGKDTFLERALLLVK